MNKQAKNFFITKEIVRKIKLYVPSQNPSSLSTLNAILGQAGVNVFDFIKQYNKITDNFLPDIILNIEVELYIDKTFLIVIKSPPVSTLLLEESYVFNKLLLLPENFLDINTISLKQLYNISYFIKKKLLLRYSVQTIFRSLLGTSKSMHLKIINDLHAV